MLSIARLLSLLGLPLAGLALMMTVGGHWAVMRGATWSRMIADFRQDGASWSSAISRTMGGEFPCEWCRALDSAARQEQERKLDVQAASRFDLAPPAQNIVRLEAPYRIVGYGWSREADPPEGVGVPLWCVPRSFQA